MSEEIFNDLDSRTNDFDGVWRRFAEQQKQIKALTTRVEELETQMALLGKPMPTVQKGTSKGKEIIWPDYNS